MKTLPSENYSEGKNPAHLNEVFLIAIPKIGGISI
jgi:hypothetical protein